MKLFSQTFRLIHINFVLMRYNIGELLLEKHGLFPIKFILYLNPFYWWRNRRLTRGERIRFALEELGPIFVKAGQIISTRRDLIPEDVALELSKLQDRVPPFSGKLAKTIIEKNLNTPIASVFIDFNLEALASASIAQVHEATLLNGDAVVIKVLRPEIKKYIERDIYLLMSFARFAERFFAEARYLKPVQLVTEIAQTLNDELDLTREAASASQLRRNFLHSEDLYVPKIYWQFCTKQILVLERIHGIPIYDLVQLKEYGIDLPKLAERGIEIFFTQVFRDSFFHADLHPGNIFVCVKNPKKPRYIVVDFGIVGALSRDDQHYLAENMMAFFNRDYERVAELHIACGWLPPNTRIDQFAASIRTVSEPIFEQPLKDISFGKLLLHLFQVARRFQINIQPQLVLLQKTLLSIEGLTRHLAPDFDMWGNAAPQIEKWLRKQVGFKAFLKRIKNNLPIWSQQLPEIPNLIFEVLKEKHQHQEMLRFNQQLSDQQKTTMATSQRLVFLFAGILFGSMMTGIIMMLKHF